MKSEAELRELHRRLVNVLGYTKSVGIKIGPVRELVWLRIALEYSLDMDTVSAREWQASIFKGIQNLEGLQKAAERSRQAGLN